MKAHISYLWYVLRHKWFVFLECCKLGIPLLGILHDWDKFLPSKWFIYVRTFYDSNGKRKKVDDDLYVKLGYALCDHHSRSKHHWQRHILIQSKDDMVALEVPNRYRREMLADWRAVSRALNDSAKRWYGENRNKILLHERTKAWIEHQLGYRELGGLR